MASVDLEGEPQPHLILDDRALLDLPPRLRDLEPADLVNGLRRLGDGRTDGILDRFRARTDEIDELVGSARHGLLLPRRVSESWIGTGKDLSTGWHLVK